MFSVLLRCPGDLPRPYATPRREGRRGISRFDAANAREIRRWSVISRQSAERRRSFRSAGSAKGPLRHCPLRQAVGTDVAAIRLVSGKRSSVAAAYRKLPQTGNGAARSAAAGQRPGRRPGEGGSAANLLPAPAFGRSSRHSTVISAASFLGDGATDELVDRDPFLLNELADPPVQ